MPEIRKDPINDRWVILAPERAKRPVQKEAWDQAHCPFCAGNEHMTPPEVLLLRNQGEATDAPRWNVRVVPNKYPALVPDESSTQAADEGDTVQGGTGVHEVFIESPDHVIDMARLGQNQYETILRAYRQRILELRTDERLRYILIYKNQGVEAGATLEHVHSQLIAMPVIPKLVQEEVTVAQAYHNAKGRCVFCEFIRKETDSGERFVVDNARYVVICPFASRFPYETWILPKQHRSCFEGSPETDDTALAEILRETMGRLNRALNEPALNYFIHSNPLHQQENPAYHWHLEIIPKLLEVGGFEWGSGSHINPVTPEQGARSLRDIRKI